MDETSITINSPYANVAELFDNNDTFPDLTFVIPGAPKVLKLHKGIVGQRSKLAQGLLKAKKTVKSDDANRIDWMFDTSRNVDRTVLVKVLRFCYGDPLSVSVQDGECCAMIAALFRLQVACLDSVIPRLVTFSLERAKENPILGTQLLMETQLYPECTNDKICELDKALARIVFTIKNIMENYEAVVKGCLMKLPAKYLEMTEYGEPHTMFSEFALRTLYVKEHDESLSRDEKQVLLNKCDWTKLRIRELKTLRDLEIVGQEVMTETSDIVLENTEKEMKEFKDRAEKAEKERDQANTESLFKLFSCTVVL